MAAAPVNDNFEQGWLTTAESDAIVGYPAQETYPGPVSEDHAGGREPDSARSGPPAGSAAPGFPSQAAPTESLAGGVITDTAFLYGHSAPIADFAAQVKPFAGSGPIADTHATDTGGVERAQQVLLPRSPGWFRRTRIMQTFNRQAQVTDNAGWAQLAANGRQDLDQYQGQDAQAYDPRWLTYSERPVLAKLAVEAHPLTGQAGGYLPDGSLPDMYAQGGQGNFGYTAPPDPAVTLTAPSSSAALGMEYVSG